MESHILDVLADRVLELGPKPAASGPYRHFKLTRDADGVAWLLFDRAEASANTLSADVIEELDSVLAALEGKQDYLEERRAAYQARRDLVVARLREASAAPAAA